MKIDDPLENLKTAAHEAGLDWSIVQDRSPILDEPTKFSARKLREPKDLSKLSRRELLTKTAHGQANAAAHAWATKNIDGFDSRLLDPDPLNYFKARRAIHVVEAFARAALSRCKIEKV